MTSARQGLLLLLVAAGILFTADAGRLSLPPLDDCHYARKGVEMLERGAFFTVTWGGELSTQHPPLQFWILSRSFALLGVGDFAARLPSILMALGIVAMTFRLGTRIFSPTAALAGAAALLATNVFLLNARRCMLEIPTCFWVTLFFLLYVESLERPRRLLLLSIPLAAGILTKSVVGLVPLAVLGAALLVPELRPRRRGLPWLAAGLCVGLLGGASWTVHQAVVHGMSAVREHYFTEVGRAVNEGEAGGTIFAWPLLLLRTFQPVVLPGLLGAALAWRGAARRSAPLAALLSLWVIVWLAVAAFSSARSSRYVWPVVVPLALLSGHLLAAWSPRVTRVFAFAVVPVALAAGGIAYWVAPGLLGRNVDAPFKDSQAIVRDFVPEGRSIPLLGNWSWRLANPLLYYGERQVGPASEDPDVVLAAAAELPRPVLLVEKRLVPVLDERGIRREVLAELTDWQLVAMVSAPGAERRGVRATSGERKLRRGPLLQDEGDVAVAGFQPPE